MNDGESKPQPQRSDLRCRVSHTGTRLIIGFGEDAFNYGLMLTRNEAIDLFWALPDLIAQLPEAQ